MTGGQESTALIPIGDNRPATSLQTWALEADAAYLLAERMVGTSFCPSQFKGKPVEAAAAVLAGAEVGLSPLAALRSFDIISGTAAPRALTLRAIAQAAGCQFQTLEEDERRVVMRAKRPGGEWETIEWTIARAQALGLTNKDNWKRQPQAMLVARATADLARRVAADRILGLGYAAEEVEEQAEAKPTSKRTVQRKAAAEAPELPGPAPDAQPMARGKDRTLHAVSDVDLPPLPGEDAPAREPETAPAPPPTVPGPKAKTEDRPGFATASSLRMLHALEGAAGITERGARLALYSRIAGRKVESSSDLTRIECSRLLDHLKAQTEPEPPEDGWPPDPEDGLFPDDRSGE